MAEKSKMDNNSIAPVTRVTFSFVLPLVRLAFKRQIRHFQEKLKKYKKKIDLLNNVEGLREDLEDLLLKKGRED
jgi:hypothetical protein